MPATSDDLIAYLDSLGVASTTVEHPPLHTVEKSRALRGDIPGGHVKNLFVKDKKSRLFLLVLGEDTPIDLKRAHEKNWRPGARLLRLGRTVAGGLGGQAGGGDAVRRDQRRRGPRHRRAQRHDDALRAAQLSPAGQHPHDRRGERRPDHRTH